MTSAKDIIARLNLAPHPEGGWYRQTWQAAAQAGERASGTAIYYLLERGQRSHWHRVDAAEVWHFYAGAPLKLSLSDNGSSVRETLLGVGLDAGEQPQAIVPPNCWQAAQSLGLWTLVGCTVSPGFEFDQFELAAPDWKPAER